MRAVTPYRSIDDDVEEQREDRAALAGTRRNDDDERNDIFDFGTAGKKNSDERIEDDSRDARCGSAGRFQRRDWSRRRNVERESFLLE